MQKCWGQVHRYVLNNDLKVVKYQLIVIYKDAQKNYSRVVESICLFCRAFFYKILSLIPSLVCVNV